METSSIKDEMWKTIVLKLYDSDIIRTSMKVRGEHVMTTAVINNVFLAIAISVVYLKLYLTIIHRNSPILASIYM